MNRMVKTSGLGSRTPAVLDAQPRCFLAVFGADRQRTCDEDHLASFARRLPHTRSEGAVVTTEAGVRSSRRRRLELVDGGGDLGHTCVHQKGTCWLSRPVPVARPDSVRQNSTASMVVCSPFSPETYLPPAGPVSVRVNGVP